ncbi:hypothetical protein [Niabella soli]|uniref:Nucleotidyltransferase n=1 Tax=Niabella soli DSM 19437 TaxID=929713 RepID=W0F2S9_9BACT|nr:hypothetical protein [Niabella soli]AHF17340.1 hypothetical protein NIASO_05875 [Niabella soli DSM 19437]
MANNTSDSLLTVCKLLQKYQVLYLLVGGTAVALNGYFRLSINDSGELTDKPDIDVWFNPTYENYFKLIGVIEELDYDVSEYKNEKSPNPHSSFFKLKFDEFSLDLIPQIKAPVKFIDAYKRKDTIEIEGISINVIGYPDLILDKQALGRKKDLDDVQQLKNLKNKN